MFLVLKKVHLKLYFIILMLLLVTILGVLFSINKAMSAASTTSFKIDDITCETQRKIVPSNPPIVGDDVEEIQIQLKRMGYYAGEVNGIYDGEIVEIVKKLQGELNIQVNGVADVELYEALYIGDIYTETKAKEKPQGELEIIIELDKNKLTVYEDGIEYAAFPVAIGKPSTQSPVGDWTIVNKGYMPGNAFGTRWMGLNVPWGVYGVHGTNNPGSIGHAQSAGCIRMFNKDVEKLYDWVDVGTPVSITSNRWPPSFRTEYRKGMVGQDVVYVQRALRDYGFCSGGDARFGEQTEIEVKNFQRHYRLPETGVIDENMLYLLGLR